MHADGIADAGADDVHRSAAMRIHRLELTAFGPFPGTEVVEFERLNAAGLFLLAGPTGAGKTSILDAICFALYGAVPGDRNGAKAFKSDHAPADARPRVVLDLTMRSRRFRVTREPGWTRPSRRARSGRVEEKAKATIAEYVDEEWRPHSNRVDEVGQLVTTLLGMNKDQFCQVVLLPQGEFQTFLTAGAKERHDVLESLFRTHRFQAVERWLVDHRRQLDGQCRDAEAQLDRVLARVDEVFTGIAEPALTERRPQEVGGATRLDYPVALTSLRARQSALAASAAAAADTESQTSERAKSAQHALDAARSLVDLQRQRREAKNRWDELMSSAAEVRRREREVLLARRASAFEPLLELVEEAADALRRAEIDAETALAALDPPGPVAGTDPLTWVTEEAEDLRGELASLDALIDTQNELDRRTHSLSELEDELDTVRAREVSLVTTLAGLPGEIAAARGALMAAREAAAGLPAAVETVAAAQSAKDSATRAVELGDEIVQVEAALFEARERRADARDALHLLRARRISGMAAALASRLAHGDPCPVCGSRDHPQRAEPGQDEVGPDDEAAGEDVVRRAEDAMGTLELRRERLRSERTAAAHAAAGLTPDTAQTRLRDMQIRRQACADTAASADTCAATLSRLEEKQRDGHDELARTRAALHTSEAQRVEQTAAMTGLRGKIAARIGAETSLATRRAVVLQRLDHVAALGPALHSRNEAQAAHRAGTHRLDRLVADSVFATVQQVHNAVRTETDIASGEALNRAYSMERAATEKALAHPSLLEAAQAPTPDLTALAQTAEECATRAALAGATTSRLDAAAARLDALGTTLEQILAGWAPLREQRDRADHVASMVAGTSRDNSSKTKLSHYVLAARLEQVVHAANVRLRGICGGRYELEHTLSRGVRDVRGGLGLRVLDTYTGVRRDPATLSGGETFYVSLALALGLADLVNNEIGGAELSTLFVDEGFGTLDAETLDDVMDELDALRSGGRSVGLVSHLAELRIRVPVQLSVVRSPNGSRLDDSR